MVQHKEVGDLNSWLWAYTWWKLGFISKLRWINKLNPNFLGYDISEPFHLHGKSLILRHLIMPWSLRFSTCFVNKVSTWFYTSLHSWIHAHSRSVSDHWLHVSSARFIDKFIHSFPSTIQFDLPDLPSFGFIGPLYVVITFIIVYWSSFQIDFKFNFDFNFNLISEVQIDFVKIDFWRFKLTFENWIDFKSHFIIF